MPQKTVTFRSPADRIDALDALAAQQQRDRSFLLNEAVEQYLSMNEEFLRHIEQGRRDVRKGRHVSHDQAKALAASWSKAAKARVKKSASA